MTWQSGQPYPAELSKRAVEILGLLADGLSDREIADRLVMTVNTVKWYNRQIYSILGVGSRTQAIARAHELNLLTADPAEVTSSANLPRHNLPVETTRFVGREAEIASIKTLLQTVRLLTLVGPPGTGKTRLALHAAWELVDMFSDGVYFVSLAALNDPAQVTDAVAAAVGVSISQRQPLLETLKHALRERHVLLVLDNFEHLLPAATHVSELLTAALHLKVLATSREPLHLYGEQEFIVPPLLLPDDAHHDVSDLLSCESTALFVQQARAVRADFELTPENVHDVAQICVRLEGLPLAIELAAAYIKLLPPRTLLARLTNRLDALTGGAHDLPLRQQTLRNTIEWSYNLLDEGEKLLFARLAVFQGVCSLEAIESVCGAGLPIDVFEGLASLVDKSLIQQQEPLGHEPYFIMLETIHEYAWERLRDSGDAPAIQQQHAAYYVEMAERGEPELRQAGFSYWMNRLDAEYDNLTAALAWSLGGGALDVGLRLVAALRDFWIMSSRFMQAEHWSMWALSQSNTLPARARIGVLITAGIVLYYSSKQRDLQKQLLEQAIEAARAVGDQLNLARALAFLAASRVGSAAQYEDALSIAEEALAIFRTVGNKPGMAQVLNIIGEIARVQGDHERAQAAYEACLLVVRETGEARREAMCFNNLGSVMMNRGEVQRAKGLFHDALVKRLEVGHDKRGMLTNILFLSGAIAAEGEPQRAARLFGAVKAILETMGVELEPADQPEYHRDLAYVRARLDDATFDACWNEGRSFSLQQTIAYALES